MNDENEKDEIFTVVNKKSGKGNGNSVINNHELGRDHMKDYVSGDAAPSSASHKFEDK